MNLAAKPEPFQHITVLLNEAVDALNIQENGSYVDGTFGRGGHSRLILSKLGKEGRLVVFDKDPQAIVVARDLAATRCACKRGTQWLFPFSGCLR